MKIKLTINEPLNDNQPTLLKWRRPTENLANTLRINKKTHISWSGLRLVVLSWLEKNEQLSFYYLGIVLCRIAAMINNSKTMFLWSSTHFFALLLLQLLCIPPEEEVIGLSFCTDTTLKVLLIQQPYGSSSFFTISC